MYVLIVMRSGAVSSVHRGEDVNELKDRLSVDALSWHDYGLMQEASISGTLSVQMWLVP